MRAYKLAENEEKFARTLVDSYGKKFKKVPGTFENVVGIRPQLETYYYKEVFKKEYITFHHTAGLGPMSDIGTLTQPNNHVSTSYVLARSGAIYETFNPIYYSYHIGPKASVSNKEMSRKSIGIEISNIGQLHEDPADKNILLDSYNKPYCLKSDTQYYVEKTYRGHKYFATYTDEQYKALDTLTTNLCRKFNIQRSFVPEGKRYDYFDKLPPVGIFSHANVRKDKADVSISFDYSKVSGK